MNKPIHDRKVNRIILKPRFKIKVDEDKEIVMDRFRDNLKDINCKYCSKIVDNHIVIDVPKEEEHFWSPQLHVEVENEKEQTIVKGVLGPQPKIWTFFMFLHFAVAIAFFVFFVMFYTKWSLKQDYIFSMIMFIAMPVIWLLLYFVGQLGKKFGYDQMVELHDFLMKTINKDHLKSDTN
ncbi:MAG: ABC transporter ATP-binding protein [Flavobacteriaceae bacterium]|nr:ABC transporter ATP-binding protein [Flavobacteriaceae bacterium]